MTTCEFSASVKNAIERVVFDTSQAIEQLKINVISNGAYGEAEVDRLFVRMDRYKADLVKVVRAHPMGRKKQFTLAKKLLLCSFNARLCAVLRSAHMKDDAHSLAEVYHFTRDLNVWKPLAEPVVIHWRTKDPKRGYRPIVISGLMRTAQCLMVRDVLSIMDIDSTFDFTTKGGGGEKNLLKNICKDIEVGYNWWWIPDIENCFGSIKPGHLGWLPIDRRLIRNIIFLPKCAQIVVPKYHNSEVILQYVNTKYSDLSVNGEITSLNSITAQIVRQGLLQGSVLAPLLARAVIKRKLDAALSGKNVRRYTFSDDLFIGSHTKGECQAAKQAVTNCFLSHPAGPIELHQVPVISAYEWRVQALGYVLQPGNGHGKNFVHVKPSQKRIQRFVGRLEKRLSKADPGADLFQVAEQYRVSWFKAQHAWTKVPSCSNEASRAITATYVDDFIHGFPMGGGVHSNVKPTQAKQ